MPIINTNVRRGERLSDQLWELSVRLMEIDKFNEKIIHVSLI